MKTLHSTEKQDDLQPVLSVFDHSPLKKIVQKARFLLSLDHVFQTLLPESFRAYVHVMNVQEGVVILGVSNASVSTRIQFLSEQLLRDLRKKTEYAAICGIKCKVCVQAVRY